MTIHNNLQQLPNEPMDDKFSEKDVGTKRMPVRLWTAFLYRWLNFSDRRLSIKQIHPFRKSLHLKQHGPCLLSSRYSKYLAYNQWPWWVILPAGSWSRWLCTHALILQIDKKVEYFILLLCRTHQTPNDTMNCHYSQQKINMTPTNKKDIIRSPRWYFFLPRR